MTDDPMVDGLDFGMIARIWEQCAFDKDASDHATFLDVYGYESVDGNANYSYAIAAKHPTIAALVAQARHNEASCLYPGADALVVEAHVGYALVGLDFGPTYLVGYA